MRASTRRRITLALIGLLAVVLIGWFVQEATAAETSAGTMPAPHGTAGTHLSGQGWTTAATHPVDGPTPTRAFAGRS